MAYSVFLRLGDNNGTDLPEDETTTIDNDPWVELTDTLTFVGEGQPAMRRWGGIPGMFPGAQLVGRGW